MKVYVIWIKAGEHEWDWDMAGIYRTMAAAENVIAMMETKYNYVMKVTEEIVYDA